MDAKQVLDNFVERQDPLETALRAALLELTTGQMVSRAYRAQEVIETALAKLDEPIEQHLDVEPNPFECSHCKGRIRDLHIVNGRPERYCSEQCMNDYLAEND